MKWVLVDVEGGAGNQMIHLVGALILAISIGRPLVLKHNTVLSFPFDPVLSFFDEDDLVQQGVLPPPNARNGSTMYTLNVFSAAGVKFLSCGDWEAELSAFPLVKFQGAYGIHLPLINPHMGPWLRSAFREIPFFFLSHFLWSGSAERAQRPLRVRSQPPQKWDGEHESLRAFEEVLRSSRDVCVDVVVGVHVRTDTNHPMYYFDQSQLLPHRPDAFCGGDTSRFVPDC